MACPKTFTSSRKKKERVESTSIASIKAKLASPKRKKTTGFGIITSTRERKKHKPANKGNSLSSNDTPSIQNTHKHLRLNHHIHSHMNAKIALQFLRQLPFSKKQLSHQNVMFLPQADDLHQ